MKKEEIDKVGIYIECQDMISLKEVCKSLKIKDFNNFDDIGYAIMKEVEKEIDLMNYFKETAKKRKGLRVLIQYCIKTENIRFFIDNKEQYELSNSFINEMKNRFDERYKQKIKHTNEEREKISKRMRVTILIVMVAIAVWCTIYFLEPYFVTHITKKAIIMEAEIVEQGSRISLAGIPTNSIYVKYQYVLNGIKYTNEEEIIVVGYALNLKDKSNIEIYYHIEDPSESHLYINSWHMNCITICFDIMTAIGIIITIKDYKVERKSR